MINQEQLFINREYALRRTRDAFRTNKTLSDDAIVKASIQEAKHNLDSIKRQVSGVLLLTPHRHEGLTFFILDSGPCLWLLTSKVLKFFLCDDFLFYFLQVIVGNMYKSDKLVIEK